LILGHKKTPQNNKDNNSNNKNNTKNNNNNNNNKTAITNKQPAIGDKNRRKTKSFQNTVHTLPYVDRKIENKTNKNCCGKFFFQNTFST
jgi:hypothetical protein